MYGLVMKFHDYVIMSEFDFTLQGGIVVYL